MRKYFFILFISVLFYPVYTNAQDNMQDVIYLKNGSVYRGNIKDVTRDSVYRIEIAGGSTISIAAAGVTKITKEPTIVMVYSRTLDSLKQKYRSRNWGIGFEGSLCYILSIDGANAYNNSENIKSGAGISLMPEIKRGRRFSVLVGMSFQYLMTTDVVNDLSPDGTTINIDKGYQFRCEVPVWFRWTFEKKLPVFFQFGFGAVGNFYRGWGSNFYGGGLGPGSISYNVYGWQKINAGSIAPLLLGVGIRKKISPGIELVSCLEASLAEYMFPLYQYTPNIQFHLGINFNKKRTK